MNANRSEEVIRRTIVSADESQEFHATPVGDASDRDYQEKQIIFSKGDKADALFVIRSGSIKLMMTTENGKRAVLRIANAQEIFGEDCLARRPVRNSTAVAIEPSAVTQVPRSKVIRAIRENSDFAKEFVAHLLARLERSEDELADQILNSSEKRLARVLLAMSGVRAGSNRVRTLPTIDQRTLAEMVGTTRSRVSFFMNRFRRLGLIDYNGSLRVYPKLFTFANKG
jgi:CRP/FNR family transcriptional regulator, cyclic AMP receptor protein